MRFCKEVVMTMWLSVALIIVLSCILSSVTAWEERDGIKIVVPKRMAKLLKRITKYKLTDSIDIGSTSTGQSSSVNRENILTAIKKMHLNGLRKVDPIQKAPKTLTDLLLPTKTERTLLRRQKRSVVPKKPKTAKVCNSGKIYVNLTKYSNIVAPAGFTTHYCGKWYPIPISDDPVTKLVSKAILETFNAMKTFSSLVFSNAHCCAPKKTKTLVVLYNNPKKFTMIKYIQKVVVRSCGCRTS